MSSFHIDDVEVSEETYRQYWGLGNQSLTPVAKAASCEWLGTSYTPAMLRILEQSERRGLITIRPRRLLRVMVACTRRVRHLLEEDRFRRFLQLAELAADGMATVREMEDTILRTDRPALEEYFNRNASPRERAASIAAQAVWWTFQCACPDAAVTVEDVKGVCGWVCEAVRTRPDQLSGGESDLGYRQEAVAQSRLLRCIFGNPFHPVGLDPSWLVFDGGLVKRLAGVIDDEEMFESMPVLGDALEEAGCTDLDALAHCREPGEHARGCWVLRMLLSKE